MQHISLLCVGKLKERFYIDACAEYQKRLGRCCALELTELPEQRLPEDPSPAQVAAALDREAEAIEPRLKGCGTVVALCVEGRELSSPELAETLSRCAARGGGRVAFLIGGSYGLSRGIKDRADLRLSMSPMTFPHHLARVMLLEQLYRAYQIQQGTRYHK